MRTLFVALTHWFWYPLIWDTLQQAREEGVIDLAQTTILQRALNADHIYDRL